MPTLPALQAAKATTTPARAITLSKHLDTTPSQTTPLLWGDTPPHTPPDTPHPPTRVATRPLPTNRSTHQVFSTKGTRGT